MAAPAQVRAWAVFGSIGLEGLQQTLRQLSTFDAAGAKSGKGMQAFSAVLATTAGKAAILTTALAGVAAAIGTITFAGFEQEMARSTAIMGDLSQEMRSEMESAARDVARVTSFSAKEAAEAYFFLASAGLDAAQSVAALPQVARFAQAGNFGLARATDLLTDAQSALGLASDNAAENLANLTRISDIMVKTNTLANTSVEQLADALTNKVGAAAKQLGKDLPEVSAALAVMADQGLKGRIAGERLNIILRDLPTAALNNAAAFRDLGIEVFDTEGNVRNLADIIGDFERELGHLTPQQRITEIQTLNLNQRLADGISILMGGSTAMREYEDSLQDAGGTTDEVARRQLDNLIDQLGILKSEFLDLAMILGGPVVKAMGVMTSQIIEMIREIRAWTDASRTARDEANAWRQDALNLARSYDHISMAQRRAMGGVEQAVIQDNIDLIRNYSDRLADLAEVWRTSGEISTSQLEAMAVAVDSNTFTSSEAMQAFLADLRPGWRALAEENANVASGLRALTEIGGEFFQEHLLGLGDVQDETDEWSDRIRHMSLEMATHLNRIGQLTDSELLAKIREYIEAAAEGSDDLMRLREREFDLIQQINDKRKKMEEEIAARIDNWQQLERNRLEEELRNGEISEREFIRRLNIFQERHAKFSNEWMEIEARKRQIREDQARQEEREIQRQDQLIQRQIEFGRVLRQDRIATIQTMLEEEELAADRRMALEDELFRHTQSLMFSRIQEARTAALASKDVALEMLQELRSEMEEFGDVFPALLVQVDDAIARVGNTIRDQTDEWADFGEQIGEATIQGIVRGMLDGEVDLERIFKTILERSIIFGATKLLGIASPSKVTFGFGQEISRGMALGIQNAAPEIERAWAQATGMITAPDTLGGMRNFAAGGVAETSLKVEFTGTPPAPANPLEAARDATWQEWLRESLIVAEKQGFKA